MARYPDVILPLTEFDLPKLHISNHHRLTPGDAAAWVCEMQGLHQWHPASGEFLFVGPWRHRSDIPTIRLLSSFSHEKELLQASIDEADRRGMTAYVTWELHERRKSQFYQRIGFDLLEGILTYEHTRIADFAGDTIAPRQEFCPVTPADVELFQAVKQLDTAAFTWLWRNSDQEFHWWLSQPTVQMFAGMFGGRVCSYYGVTLFQNYAHLDRIAVHPDFQGQGLGRETLHVALRRLASLGVRTVGLSTQRHNGVSTRLYEDSGFRRTPHDDFQMYGVVFRTAPDEGTSQ